MNNDNPKMQEALAKFPGTFGLKAFAGTFRVSPSSSYINDDGVPMLYTEIHKEDGEWVSFCKGTEEELSASIVRQTNKVVRHWSIVERANGVFEVDHNPNGRIGTGNQEFQPPAYIYRGFDFSQAIESLTPKVEDKVAFAILAVELAAKVRGYFTNQVTGKTELGTLDGDRNLYELASRITDKILQPQGPDKIERSRRATMRAIEKVAEKHGIDLEKGGR